MKHLNAEMSNNSKRAFAAMPFQNVRPSRRKPRITSGVAANGLFVGIPEMLQRSEVRFLFCSSDELRLKFPEAAHISSVVKQAGFTATPEDREDDRGPVVWVRKTDDMTIALSALAHETIHAASFIAGGDNGPLDLRDEGTLIRVCRIVRTLIDGAFPLFGDVASSQPGRRGLVFPKTGCRR